MKYPSKRKVRFGGRDYRSKLEVTVARELRKLKGKKKLKKIEYEKEKLPFIIEANYLPDFVVTRNDGSTIIIEVKGILDRDTQKKMLAVKRCHPDLEIVFYFWKDNLIRKGGKMRYSDWCEKHGFKYCIGKLDEEWF